MDINFNFLSKKIKGLNKTKTVYTLILLGIFLLTLSQLINKIESLTILFTIYYLVVISYFIINNKNILCDYNFIFINVFFLYSILSPIHYILNNFTSIPMSFEVNYNIIFQVVKEYFFIFGLFSIYAIIFTSKNYKHNNNTNLIKYFNEVDLSRDNIFIIYDVIAVICLIIFIKPILFDRISLLNVNKGEYISLINAKILKYSYYYFQAYSIYVISNLFNLLSRNKLNKKNMPRYFLICIYWMLNLKIGIRFEFMVVFLFSIIYIFSINVKIKKKYILYIGCFAIILLFIGVLREINTLSEIKEKNFMDIFYPMAAEFILPQYISYFYFTFHKTLLLGKSYLIYSLLYLFPSNILSNKPLPFGVEFMIDSKKVGAALAFNPVAEGMINFGENFSLVLVCILIIISILIYFFKKKDPIFYIICTSSIIAFCRGQFSIWITDIIFLYIILKFISLTQKRRKKVGVFNNISNA